MELGKRFSPVKFSLGELIVFIPRVVIRVLQNPHILFIVGKIIDLNCSKRCSYANSGLLGFVAEVENSLVGLRGAGRAEHSCSFSDNFASNPLFCQICCAAGQTCKSSNRIMAWTYTQQD